MARSFEVLIAMIITITVLSMVHTILSYYCFLFQLELLLLTMVYIYFFLFCFLFREDGGFRVLGVGVGGWVEVVIWLLNVFRGVFGLGV